MRFTSPSLGSTIVDGFEATFVMKNSPKDDEKNYPSM
jgi:hypothetical protein